MRTVSTFGNLSSRFAKRGFQRRSSVQGTMANRRFGSSKSLANRNLGAVIVEMAICMPFMILLVFGCLEINSSLFLNQTLTSAAHEGALVGLRLQVTEAEVIDRVAVIMRARGIRDYTVHVETYGGPFEDLEPGERFSIQIEAPRVNSIIDLSTVRAEVTALRP